MALIKKMNNIINQFKEQESLKNLILSIKSKLNPIVISGLNDVAKNIIAEVIQNQTKKPICIITYNEIQAKKIIKDLKNFTDSFVFFPKKEIVTYDYVVESKEIDFSRIDVLNQIAEKNVKIIITTIECVMQSMISKEILYENKIRLKVGTSQNIETLKQKLISLGYEGKEIIEARGQFCVRGGIIDVAIEHEKGLRIEFWGDEIDSIRTFNLLSQRSDDTINEITIFPAHENILERDIQEICKDIINNQKNIEIKNSKIGNNITIKISKDYAAKLELKLNEDIEKIKNGDFTNKINRYFNSFYQKQCNFLDYLDDETLILIDEKSKILQRKENIIRDNNNLISSIIDKQKVVPDIIKNTSNFSYEIKNKQVIYLERQDVINTKIEKFQGLWSVKNETIETNNIVNLKFREITFYKSELELFLDELENEVKLNKKIIVFLGNKIEEEKLKKVLEERNIKSRFEQDLDFSMKNKDVVLTIGELSTGFEFYDANLVVISSEELFGKVIKKERLNPIFKKSEKIVFADLENGDYIVHKKYGIGKFIGINTIRSDGITKDYIKIKYLNDDILYVPTNDLDNIRKYSGGDSVSVKLNKLGGKEWKNTTARVKRNLREVAKELVELYSLRSKAKGYAFGKDTIWQKQFEDDFPYQETGDQLRCIDETKKDMETPKPMDRLLCGDVGYGKTEVAIRAAFKAVMDGKQVVYLVPTTILANQQYEFFKSRMEKYGAVVEVLNRFKTKKQQMDIVKKIALGKVDVIIGTHRLLSKDVEFKDLGLLIIDEEHRFGVRHKEKIKQMKNNVDVLSMSATPIPRTMHMSIIGIRDMSVIYDPPNNRMPVQTYVLEYDDEIIKEAITKELERDGQVFYLYNTVDTIESKKNEIKKLVPEAEIAFAHGQMSGKEIEEIMERFINKEIDVIVCTTILESGIDIPNANTIIVENADRLGLAQLYQIRGRVGRSNRQAYAYITYKRDKMITEVSEKRLKAIKEFTEFGSGFKIAVRDLEIRGAGSLLGEIQHGHMADVGYETYCELLEEAVKEEQGIKIEPQKNIQIDLNISSFLPDSYISNNSQKIEMYQNIALCKNELDIQTVIDEMIDRYGVLSEDAENLIEIARIKNIGKEKNVTKITQKLNMVIFYKNPEDVDFSKLNDLAQKYRNKIVILNNEQFGIRYKLDNLKDRNVIAEVKKFLRDL